MFVNERVLRVRLGLLSSEVGSNSMGELINNPAEE